MTSIEAKGIGEALQRARAALAKLLVANPDCGGPAGEILGALVEIETSVVGALDEHDAESRARQSPTRRFGRNKPKQYKVEKLGGEVYIAEYRDDDPRPFRAPKEVFDAVVTVVSTATSPLLAADILDAVGRELGDPPSEYQVRLCLRFLTSKGVGLLQRHRAHYIATGSQRFKRAATSKFGALPSP